MQSQSPNTDFTSISIELNECRSKFDQAMREGHDYNELKHLYLQMKELECYVNALQWDPEHHMAHRHTPTNYSWL